MRYLLSLRDRRVGGPVVPGRLELRPRYSQAAAAGAALGSLERFEAETRIVFLIHGFNVNGEAGELNLLTLADKLRLGQEWGVVSVLLPGDHWTRAASYPFEADDADDSGAELARFIETHASRSASIHLVAHSLGSRVALETMWRLQGRSWFSGRIGQVCLCAAAVDDTSLGDPQVYEQAARVAQRVAVLASERDAVLRRAYPVGDLLQSWLSWKEESGSALGYHGPRAVPARGILTPGSVLHTQIPGDQDVGNGDYVTYIVKHESSPAGTKLRKARDYVRTCLTDPAASLRY